MAEGARERLQHAQLLQCCEKALAAVGYDLVAMEYAREAHGRILRIFIDHQQGELPAQRGDKPRRIDHKDCERASRHLSAVLDVEDPIAEPYRLEVSSPGVLRPLQKERDFRRFIGFAVQVKTSDPIDGRKSFKGMLEDVSDGVVRVRDIDGGERAALWSIPFLSIRKAQLAEEY